MWGLASWPHPIVTWVSHGRKENNGGARGGEEKRRRKEGQTRFGSKERSGKRAAGNSEEKTASIFAPITARVKLNMTRINRKKLAMYLVVQEIISDTIIFLHTIVALILQCKQLGSRRRQEGIVRYVMADRIPDQVSHMRRLSSFSDSNCVDNLRMDRSALVFLVKPKSVDDNCNNPRWKPFKGCLGALDGSYIDVQVLKAHKPRYRTRKGSISVNVLEVVDQDMKFVYALLGWEGSVVDSRVLCDAVGRPNGLRVPTGK
ncbi:hypothetical protein BUALT_Bualt14G0030600 [Buddleja alternifolia]|uniref:DDE Tnp4 domain-containing protein n=1 Tax=Buddleja alternifolia TaxID=168488 RepID=A0AAV6WNI1_9LAMI|nr:hypothetical protein BUALT_Bualt14G0030600 [Buddleja alternifolia]